jgi:DNA polymerase-3 subunit epsilon
MKEKNENLIIQEKGRSFTESAFVLIKDGNYVGYGFMDKETQINTFDDLEAFLIPQKNTLESERIIQSFITRNPDKLQKHIEAHSFQ